MSPAASLSAEEKNGSPWSRRTCVARHARVGERGECVGDRTPFTSASTPPSAVEAAPCASVVAATAIQPSATSAMRYPGAMPVCSWSSTGIGAISPFGVEVGLAARHHAAGEQRAGDELRLAGAVAVVEREQRGDQRAHRAHVVHEAEAVPHRVVALTRAGDLPAARRLEELVVAGPVGACALRSVRAGVAVDDVGVHRAHRRLVEAEAPRARACAGCGGGCRHGRAARERGAARPADLRSSATPRLPRWQPKNDHSTQRMPSPPGGSTFTTSAPRSLSSIGPSGPARNAPASTTCTPSSGCCGAGAGRPPVARARLPLGQHLVGVRAQRRARTRASASAA